MGDDDRPWKPLRPSSPANLWWLADALTEIANQQAWDTDARHKFMREAVAAARLPAGDSRRLVVRDLQTQGEKLGFDGEADAWVRPSELNAWLAADQRTFRWSPSAKADSQPSAGLPQEDAEIRQARRYEMCLQAGLIMPADDYAHLPKGIGELAATEQVSRQAFAKDVKAHIRRLAKRSGS